MYRVRPGHGCGTNLIEFARLSDDQDFRAVLRRVLADAGARMTRNEDLWMNDEVICQFTSDFGDFEVSSDNWGMVFILTEDNRTIDELDRRFRESGQFERQEQ